MDFFQNTISLRSFWSYSPEQGMHIPGSGSTGLYESRLLLQYTWIQYTEAPDCLSHFYMHCACGAVVILEIQGGDYMPTNWLSNGSLPVCCCWWTREQEESPIDYPHIHSQRRSANSRLFKLVFKMLIWINDNTWMCCLWDRTSQGTAELSVRFH